jgi:hypothetical protein
MTILANPQGDFKPKNELVLEARAKAKAKANLTRLKNSAKMS